MPKKALQIHILKKILPNEDFKKVLKAYNIKVGHRTWPTQEDWELFEKNEMTLAQWQKHWGLKATNSTTNRLGSMYLKKGQNQN